MENNESNKNNNNDNLVLIIMGVVVLGFIFGLKPIYQTVVKLQTGTLFEKKEEIETPAEEEEPEEEEVYQILQPEGTRYVACKKIVSSEGGDKTIQASLYYTDSKLKSIKEEFSYSSISDEYSNYILSEQSKFKQRRNLNLENKGYSIEIDLVSTTTLDVSAVYLLEDTALDEVVLEEDDELDLLGIYDEDINEVVAEYTTLEYTCEW